MFGLKKSLHTRLFFVQRYEENIKRENFYADICLTIANRLIIRLFF